MPAQSTMKFVIRLCASEVDRKSIHSDVYHEGRWLLWYLLLSQTITMQSVHTPCRPPPAAETTLNNNLKNPGVLLWHRNGQSKVRRTKLLVNWYAITWFGSDGIMPTFPRKAIYQRLPSVELFPILTIGEIPIVPVLKLLLHLQ